MAKPPEFNIDMAAFWQDPYPILAKMRKAAPIALVPQLGGIVFSRRDDIFVCEKNVEVFSSEQPEGLMTRLMGQNLMRKDGAAHEHERKAIFPAVSPKTVRDHWQARFEALADEVLQRIESKKSCDMCRDIAMPISGEALKLVTGLTNVTYEEMDQWSQAMIDGIANYVGDQAVEQRCHAATAAIDQAINEMIPRLETRPDFSMLSAMLAAGLAAESISANIKLAISGGQNEPRDVIAGLVWALLMHRDQLAEILAGRESWRQAFEEYCRWISPIGMTPREIARDFTYKGFDLQKGSRVFFMYGSANRDEDYFSDADRFNIHRDVSGAISFGAGPHFCAGAFVARSLVGQVAVPKIFDRLKGLRLQKDADVTFGGWAFRGALAMPVCWD